MKRLTELIIVMNRTLPGDWLVGTSGLQDRLQVSDLASNGGRDLPHSMAEVWQHEAISRLPPGLMPHVSSWPAAIQGRNPRTCLQEIGVVRTMTERGSYFTSRG